MWANTASNVALVVKNSPPSAGDIRDTGSIPVSGRSPGVRKWQPTPVFMPGESHRQRSLVGYHPWVAKSQTGLKQLSTHMKTAAMLNLPSII